MDMPVSLRLVHLPGQLALSSHVPGTVMVRMEGLGFDLVRMHWMDSVVHLDVDLSKAVLGRQTIPVTTAQFRSRLSGIHPVSLSLVNLDLDLDTRITAELPIRLRAKLVPDPDYILVGEPLVIPNLFKVSGARNLLTRVAEIPTDSLVFSDLDGKDTLQIPLAMEGLPQQLELPLRSVQVVVNVQKRATRVFTHIPVQLVGNYPRGNYYLEPDSIDLEITAGKQVLSQIQPSEIRAMVEFSRFEVEGADSVAPNIVVHQSIASWSSFPATLHLRLRPGSHPEPIL